MEKNHTVHFLVISFCETIKTIASDVTTITHSPWGFNDINFFYYTSKKLKIY